MRPTSLLAAVLYASACGLGASEPAAPEPVLTDVARPHLTVWVSRDGSFLLDGRPGTLGDLEVALVRLDGVDGVVWYGRDDPENEPAPEAMQVIRRVADHSRPIAFSTRPDFADVAAEAR
ncbi:MAG: hypothetical protein H6733_14250 [Alphaproteobacteria bacterium]|nr:hypothetical protein [Alphaproteobacteria bacterium]